MSTCDADPRQRPVGGGAPVRRPHRRVVGGECGGRHVPPLCGRSDQAGPGRRGELTHRVPQAAHRAGAAGRLGRAQILPRVRQRHIHVGQPGVQLVGATTIPNAVVMPWPTSARGTSKRIRLSAVTCSTNRSVSALVSAYHIAEIRDVGRLRQAGHHSAGLRWGQNLRADSCRHGQRAATRRKRRLASPRGASPSVSWLASDANSGTESSSNRAGTWCAGRSWDFRRSGWHAAVAQPMGNPAEDARPDTVDCDIIECFVWPGQNRRREAARRPRLQSSPTRTCAGIGSPIHATSDRALQSGGAGGDGSVVLDTHALLTREVIACSPGPGTGVLTAGDGRWEGYSISS